VILHLISKRVSISARTSSAKNCDFRFHFFIHSTNTPFLSAMPMTARVSELNSKKSFLTPSLKITAFSVMVTVDVRGDDGHFKAHAAAVGGWVA
jgi:hypothetical protein